MKSDHDHEQDYELSCNGFDRRIEPEFCKPGQSLDKRGGNHAMLIMIPYSLDVLVAMGQYLVLNAARTTVLALLLPRRCAAGR